MPNTEYFSLKIGNKAIDIENVETFPFSMSYALEDVDSFDQKKGSTAFDVEVPATTSNSQAANSFHNPNIQDLTEGEFFKSQQSCEIKANGKTLLTGKAFLKSAKHTDRPTSLTFDIYGGNSEWIIDLKDVTILDCVNPLTHLFNGTVVTDSFSFDGTSETQDYVYAPVRYLQEFDPYHGQNDVVCTIFHLKPSISIYWLLYRAFKAKGYKISSTFFDSNYFRRMVMPWTWGSFLYTEETLFAPLSFRAMCTHRESVQNRGGSWNEWVSPTSASVSEIMTWTDVSSGGVDGGFQGTPGLYRGAGMAGFPNNHDLNYYYPAGYFLGTIAMGFELQVYYSLYVASGNSAWTLTVVWFNNGVQVATDQVATQGGHGITIDNVVVQRELVINPGDIISCVMRVDASAGISPLNWYIGAPYPSIPASANYSSSYFKNTYIKKAVNSPVNFKDYSIFSKYKVLDLLRGVADTFNLSFATDPITKTVTIEPTHDYNLAGTSHGGYYKSDQLDWTAKQDLSKQSELTLYSDCEKQFEFSMKPDGNDAGVNIMDKRFGMTTGLSRYLFPDRFQSGIKAIVNRFFSPVAHIHFINWGGVTGVVPQLIAIIPENVSNTSKSVDENSFEPKIAFYKGNTSGVGGWFFQFDPTNPATLAFYSGLPYMFAVNYKPGGQLDPILTYNDQGIYPPTGSAQVAGLGLMRTFFLRRLAIMRNGKLYSSWFNLQNIDVENTAHREQIRLKGARYNLVSIGGYKPLKSETTAVVLWQDSLPTLADSAACFPSIASVTDTLSTIPANDLKFSKNFILKIDIPNGS